MTASKKLVCQNQGCGKYFEANSDVECLFHSGGPVFHDGLKGWSCCTKRVVDFGAFLKVNRLLDIEGLFFKYLDSWMYFWQAFC
jgi:hypothetical protein